MVDDLDSINTTSKQRSSLLVLPVLISYAMLLSSYYADVESHILIKILTYCPSYLLNIFNLFQFIKFLADRTNSRAIATVFRPSSSSSSSSSVTLCIVAKRCVLEQKSLLRAYRKSYMRKRLVPK